MSHASAASASTSPAGPATKRSGSEPPQAAPPPRVPAIEREALARFETWEPKGTVRDVCCDMCSPDAIIGMGIAQNIHFLQMSWARFTESCGDAGCCGEEDMEILDAFAQAIALTMRRCPAQVQPLLADVIARAPAARLKPETMVRLAHVVADLGARDEAYAVLAKSAQVEGLKPPFYLALLRLATETLTPPDMSLAIDVNDRMVAAGFEQTAMSMRMLLAGMSRMVEPPVAAAIRLYKFRQQGLLQAGAPASNIEGCLTSCFFGVLDSAVGREAAEAAEFVRSLPPEVVHAPISDVCAKTPCKDRAGCFVAACTRYLLVDPATVDLSEASVNSIPADTYLIFLYSTLRHMAARRHTVCSANPFTKKLDDVRALLERSDRAVVIPYGEELGMRAALPDGADRPSSNQDRLMAFIRVVETAKCDKFTAAVLSADPGIARACGDCRMPCFRSIATVGPMPAPSSSNTSPAPQGGCPNAGDRTAACTAMRNTFCGGKS